MEDSEATRADPVDERAADQPLSRDAEAPFPALRPFDAALLLARARDADVLPGVPLS